MSTNKLRDYIESFALEEGGRLEYNPSSIASNALVWADWHGRHLVMIEINTDPLDGTTEYGLAFSLDMASYEVAKFCQHFEFAVGPWRAIEAYFLVIPESDDPTRERMIHGDKASCYRAFRDCGLLPGGSH
jgi:hypothetical protein